MINKLTQLKKIRRVSDQILFELNFNIIFKEIKRNIDQWSEYQTYKSTTQQMSLRDINW